MDSAPALHQPTLTGDTVELRPLQAEHAEQLLDAAADGELWNLKVTVIPGPATVDAYIATALSGRAQGTVMPFVIVRRNTDESGTIVGSTRFWKIDRANRKMEIGHTWLARSAQRTRINTEAKFLLLRHAFEQMQATRVQFTTDERIMPDGHIRNSVRFSIIEPEWPTVKARLLERLGTETAYLSGQ